MKKLQMNIVILLLSTCIEFGIAGCRTGAIRVKDGETTTRGRQSTFIEVFFRDGTKVRLAKDVMYSGSEFEILIRLTHPSYIYLIQYYTPDGSAVLYPGPNSHVQRLPGLLRLPPSPGDWLKMDNNVGLETLYIVVSASEIIDVDVAVAALSKEIKRSPRSLTASESAERPKKRRRARRHPKPKSEQAARKRKFNQSILPGPTAATQRSATVTRSVVIQKSGVNKSDKDIEIFEIILPHLSVTGA